MRRIVTLLCLLGFVAPFAAASPVTVAELEHFLESKAAKKATDDEVAKRLGAMVLTEQLTQTALARLEAANRLGPKAVEQLDLLAEESVFHAPPAEEIPAVAPPDAARQKQIIEAAAAFAKGTLRRLPDFLAVRQTVSFSNAPAKAERKHSRHEVPLHFLVKSNKEIAYRDGREVDDAAGQKSIAGGGPNGDSLTTWGEFGPILDVVFHDAVHGTMTWSRWQRDTKGHLLAVFHFAVPRSASTYEVDLCCYAIPPFESLMVPFSRTPGYQGELAVDPATGVIAGLTLQSELAKGAPVQFTGMAVRYGPVEIGGKWFVCPVEGLAVSKVPKRWGPKPTDVDVETFVNVIRFRQYRRFATTTKILTRNPGAAK